MPAMAHPSIVDSYGDEETYVEVAAAAVVAPPVVAHARFASPRLRTWLWLALAVIAVAPSAFALAQPVLAEQALAWGLAQVERLAPLTGQHLSLVGVVVLSRVPRLALFAPFLLGAFFALVWMLVLARSGRVRLTTEVLEGKRILGGRFRAPLGRIGRFSMRNGTLTLATRDGKRLCKLERVEPGTFAGLVWLVSRYHGLPSSVLRALSEEPPDGLFEDVLVDHVEREFRPNGVAALRDEGFSVSLGDTHVYLPATDTMDSPNGGTSPWRRVLAPGVRDQLVGEPGIPRADRLPLKRLAKAVLRSNLYSSHKVALLTTIAANHGGTVAESPAYPSAMLRAQTAGCEVRIRVVARAYDAADYSF